jgi:hypothetical protein
MSEWNDNLDGIPLGSSPLKTVLTKDGPKTYESFERDDVILATKCGKVIKSYWLPNEERFAGLAKGELPTAWTPWPRHPGPNFRRGEEQLASITEGDLDALLGLAFPESSQQQRRGLLGHFLHMQAKKKAQEPEVSSSP